jgi:hypothetical protein
MPNPIELELIPQQPIPAPPTPPVIARSEIDNEQLQTLISIFANANPALVILPEGKTFLEVKGFNVRVNDDGSGVVTAIF